MDLSKKLSSGDHGLDWSQNSVTPEPPKPLPPRRHHHQPPKSEPLKCPRCDSTNTKFCYFNNYNHSQPRYFCKACKRYWTKGGTLRNVPVGGGRKNKRLKTSHAAAATATNRGSPIQLGGHKNMSDILYQALIPPQSSLQHDTINAFNGKTFIGSQNQNLKFSISNLSSFDANPSSVSTTFRSMNEYDFTEKLETMEDSTITTTTMFSSSSNFVSQPWHILDTSSVMEVDLLRGQKSDRVDVTLAPQEMELMDNVLPAKYEEAREEEKLRSQREDFSDMVAEIANKRKRKMQEKDGKSKKKDFKF
ncbi:unnamed protein product [Ilex paraguariensis]|uniref:Dof zinc finger protein n=1 Tax=Ilex paraguariensis TaxID=185542 RepID=A0ABC8S6B5_9AQUA